MTSSPDCVFCQRFLRGEVDVHEDADGRVIGFAPLNPVTDGHYLVLPVEHVPTPHTNAELFGRVAAFAARIAARHASYNLVISSGPDSTQTVGHMHMHMHIVPRCPGDGLALPWTGQVPS